MIKMENHIYYEIHNVDELLETIEVLTIEINQYVEKINELKKENELLIEEIRELN